MTIERNTRHKWLNQTLFFGTITRLNPVEVQRNANIVMRPKMFAKCKIEDLCVYTDKPETIFDRYRILLKQLIKLISYNILSYSFNILYSQSSNFHMLYK